MQIIDELRARGVLITNRGGEWCANVRGGAQATEYLTDDLQQAFEHGRALAAFEMTAPSPPDKPPTICRKSRRPTSARAQRRRMIRAHNHRMRANALKKQRKRSGGDCEHRYLARRPADDCLTGFPPRRIFNPTPNGGPIVVAMIAATPLTEGSAAPVGQFYTSGLPERLH